MIQVDGLTRGGTIWIRVVQYPIRIRFGQVGVVSIGRHLGVADRNDFLALVGELIKLLRSPLAASTWLPDDHFPDKVRCITAWI